MLLSSIILYDWCFHKKTWFRSNFKKKILKFPFYYLFLSKLYKSYLFRFEKGDEICSSLNDALKRLEQCCHLCLSWQFFIRLYFNPQRLRQTILSALALLFVMRLLRWQFNHCVSITMWKFSVKVVFWILWELCSSFCGIKLTILIISCSKFHYNPPNSRINRSLIFILYKSLKII